MRTLLFMVVVAATVVLAGGASGASGHSLGTVVCAGNLAPTGAAAGIVDANVVVPADSSCLINDGGPTITEITGNVTVFGFLFAEGNLTFDKNITAIGTTRDRFNGTLGLQGFEGGLTFQLRVRGSVTMVRGFGELFIALATIDRNLTVVQSSVSPAEVRQNTIGGNLMLAGNRGGTAVLAQGNTIRGALVCLGNEFPPDVGQSPNVARRTIGQCAVPG